MRKPKDPNLLLGASLWLTEPCLVLITRDGLSVYAPKNMEVRVLRITEEGLPTVIFPYDFLVSQLRRSGYQMRWKELTDKEPICETCKQPFDLKEEHMIIVPTKHHE